MRQLTDTAQKLNGKIKNQGFEEVFLELRFSLNHGRDS